MTYEERRTAIVRERGELVAGPSGFTLAQRSVLLLFGIVQLLIGLRILLLAIDAREGNALVSGILALSRPLVAPFEGILRTDALHAQGAVLDLAAIVALVGWTVVELVVLAIARLGRPGERA